MAIYLKSLATASFSAGIIYQRWGRSVSSLSADSHLYPCHCPKEGSRGRSVKMVRLGEIVTFNFLFFPPPLFILSSPFSTFSYFLYLPQLKLLSLDLTFTRK